MKKLPELRGALVGLIVSAPFTAVLMAAASLGLADVVFDFFYFVRDVLPGIVLITGIEVMANTLIALGLSLIDTAKTAEQIIAVVMFVVTLIVIAVIYVSAVKRLKLNTDYRYGVGLGIVVGIILMMIVSSEDITSSASPAINAIWTMVVMLGWGVAVNWLHQEIDEPEPASDDVSLDQLDRRRFLLRMGATSAAVTVVGAGLNAIIATSVKPNRAAVNTASSEPTPGPSNLPNADASLEPAPGTRAEVTPVAEHYRIDITLQYPEVAEELWTLPITGMVENELNLTLADLKKYPSMDQWVTLACISNNVGGELIGTTKWTGVSVKKVLADAGVKDGALYMQMEAADGFYETVSLDNINKDERVMFAYNWDDKPLLEEHGFPLRIYIPDKYGMKQPKWITKIEIVGHFKEGFWVVRGWDEVARMLPTSVIDTVAVDSAFMDDSGQLRVPVGGIAHAGARSVSKVEVKVDNGPWEAAELREPLSTTSWVIWRYDWPVQGGDHTFYVRCVDGNGLPQDERIADIFPSGSTGVHSQQANVPG